jgi:beta-N-acetylhexosaminidase
MIKKVFPLLLLVLFSELSFSQTTKSHWVDSVYRALNANEKVGQLFIVTVTDPTNGQAIHEIENQIKSHEVGGLIFKNTNPHLQVKLTSHFQELSDVPLLIAQESDLTSILDSSVVFPSPLILGAIQNDTLIYRYGSLMAKQLKMLGANLLLGLNPKVSLATSLESNINTLGTDPANVTAKSLALMRGLQDNGVLVCASNFPVKQVSVLDVEDGIPVVDLQIDSLQRFPYVTLLAAGITGLAPGVKQYDFTVSENATSKKTDLPPATLASLYTGEWVRKNMHFNGLTFMDIRNIEIKSAKQKPGDAELLAFQTGNQVLMNPADIAAAIRRIKKSIKKESDYEKLLNSTVKKILEAKFDAGLWQKPSISNDNLLQRLTNPEVKLINQKIHEAAVTVIRDKKVLLPIKILENKSFAFLRDNTHEEQNTFYQYLKKYAPISAYDLNQSNEAELAAQLLKHNFIIVSVYPDTDTDWIDRLKRLTAKLPETVDVVYCDFGNSSFITSVNNYSTVLTAYTNSIESIRAVPQILFGALPSNGIIPFSPSKLIPVGTGLKKQVVQRLAYSIPEDAKMESTVLQQIDSIAQEAIKIHATPGCQVWVARNGKVIYEKSFGTLTYENPAPVTSETIYDLASVTKVSATLQTAMFMYERGLIDLYKKVSYYLPELKKTNKKDITVLDMLTHQSGLVPFLPMYPQTVKDTTFLPIYYSRKKDALYPFQVSEKLYASPALRDSVWSWVLKSKMNEKPVRTPYSYKYSDLGFLILQRLSETLLNQPLDEFMNQNYYEPLGAYTTGFNPLNRFPKQTIAPTEDDKIYRKSFVSGTVHDERAAMMGGVAGHAGLFSNANDLGKLGQMLLQNGTYGGIQYYKPETISLFTAKKFKSSRRGIGWDKPIQSDPSSPTSLFASPRTFGHTGFTGTCIWVDPEFDLVYIFLSNRVYPDRNNKLSNANIRTRIQDVIYKSIFSYVDEPKPPYIVNDYAINSGNGRPLE